MACNNVSFIFQISESKGTTRKPRKMSAKKLLSLDFEVFGRVQGNVHEIENILFAFLWNLILIQLLCFCLQECSFARYICDENFKVRPTFRENVGLNVVLSIFCNKKKYKFPFNKPVIVFLMPYNYSTILFFLIQTYISMLFLVHSANWQETWTPWLVYEHTSWHCFGTDGGRTACSWGNVSSRRPILNHFFKIVSAFN